MPHATLSLISVKHLSARVVMRSQHNADPACGISHHFHSGTKLPRNSTAKLHAISLIEIPECKSNVTHHAESMRQTYVYININFIHCKGN